MQDSPTNYDAIPDVPSERAEEIFCDALEIKSETERAAFVDRACAGDQALRSMVKELLASQAEADALFAANLPATCSVVELANTIIDESATGENGISSLPDDQEIGKQVGPYKLLQKIGEGGAGNVYLAEQDAPIRRKVAFKIIKLGMDTKSVIARFEAERQVLALMEHPNIAHVLDAGATEEGRPYFVMELAQGIQLTTYCDENNLDIPRRLELFIQICHAIQHAHQKGIIHRDIKPSNIVITRVGEEAVPKVIDFGIAKATGSQLLGDSTFATSAEQFIGTPAYMSPEQADLAEIEIDVRSDIYSLGVLLYELLTGRTPFDQKALIRSGLSEMRRRIREEEPPRPSARLALLVEDEKAGLSESRGLHPSRYRALLEGDLDWIVMKAMNKDRELRYRSADGFADDIQRFLNHEPVVARPPSRRYRFRKLVRRNKAVFATGGVAVALLLLSSTVSTWLLFRERIAQKRAALAEKQKGELQIETDVLRTSVEDQHRLAQASALFKGGEKEQADAILDGIKHPQASMENASMYREIGDWHALNKRWAKAKARFDVLTRINEFEGIESTKDDIRLAALLVEQDFPEDYERFREAMIIRCAGSGSPRIAQRVLQHGLLTPANQELMIALDQFVLVTTDSFAKGGDSQFQCWQAYVLALFSYRNGEWEQSLEWCDRAKPSGIGIPTRDFSVRLIQSMNYFQLGRHEEARTRLDAIRAEMNKLFSTDPSKSKVWQGFWYDRACVRIHLREAESLIEQTPSALD